MRKSVLLVFFVVLVGLSGANEYVNEHSRCTERTMCHEPGEYQDVDFIDEVNGEGDMGELWSGTIDIRNVTFMHNVSEKVENTSFQNRDVEGPMDKESEDKKVIFDGVIQVESLCNEPVFDVDRVKSSSYSIDVRGNDTYAVRSCHDHPTKVEYTLTLQTQSTEMEVIVNQNNVTESFQTEDFHEYEGGGEERLEENTDTEDSESKAQEQQNEGGGLLSNIIDFIMSL